MEVGGLGSCVPVRRVLVSGAVVTALLLSLLASAAVWPAGATDHTVVIHVDVLATGNNDGKSWATAFDDLNDALSAADALLSSAEPPALVEVWVAEGIYLGSFALRNNVAIYGGFPEGGGPDGNAGFDDRDWDQHTTTLDAGGFSGAGSVVTGEDLDDSPILDGFTITNGWAISGILQTGGGIRLNAASPTLANLTITENRATRGGGIYATHSDVTLLSSTVSGTLPSVDGGGLYLVSSTATIVDSVVSGNFAQNTGGGLHLIFSQVTIVDSVVSGNSANSGDGGGLFLNFNTQVTLVNSTVSDNHVASLNGRGGGLYLSGTGTQVTIVNSTVSGNAASGQAGWGGGLFQTFDSRATIFNSVISGNTAGGGPGLHLRQGSQATIVNSAISGNAPSAGAYVDGTDSALTLHNSIVWGNSGTQIQGSIVAAFGGAVTLDRSMIDTSVSCTFPSITCHNPVEGEPHFVNPRPASEAPTTAGDFRLQPNSAAINAGDGELYSDAFDGLDLDPVTTDLDGSRRFVGAAIDLGPYEFQTLLLDRYYVDETAGDGEQDGSSWTDAFTDLNAALDAADAALASGIETVEVWVAEGIYPGNYALRTDVAIYGGFPTGGGDGTFDARDWDQFTTTLDGSGTFESVVTGNGVGSTAVFDGVTVTGGSSGVGGGGIRLQNSQPSIRNSVIRGNSATGSVSGGGGLSLSNSNPIIVNSMISGNTTSSAPSDGGGGLHLVGSNPIIIDTVISDNSASGSIGSGGGLYLADSNPTIINTVISGNTTQAGVGAGLYLKESNPTIVNTSITGNSDSGSGGGGFFLQSSSPAIINSTISGNAANRGAGLYVYWNSHPTIANSIVWGNRASIEGDALWLHSQIGVDLTVTVKNTMIDADACDLADVTCEDMVDDPPHFVDPRPASAAPTTEGDYRLLPGSPAIDTGSNALYDDAFDGLDLDPLTIDLDGNPRLVNAIDLGPYEAQFTNPALTITAPESATVGDIVPVSVGLSSNGDPASFAEGWEVTLSGSNGDLTLSLDDQGQAGTTVSSDIPGPMNLSATLGGLSANATIEWVEEVVEDDPDPAEMLADLIDEFTDMALHPGTKNGVLASLNAAQRSIANGNTAVACNQLQAAMNQIAGQSGQRISADDAEALLAQIEAIRAELGC